MKPLIFLFCLLVPALVLLAPMQTKAQAPQFLTPVQPEQDICGAITVCADSYVTANSYYEFIATDNLPIVRYRHWLKVEIATGGTLLFMIRPKLKTDNYDFEVYNGTGLACANVVAPGPIRSNTSPAAPAYNQGATGLNMTSPDEHTSLGEYSKKIIANAGDVYYIALDNYGPIDTTALPFVRYKATRGYKIDFTGSTCSFFTGTPARLDSVAFRCTNYKELTVFLTKQIRKTSIAPDASDFELSPSPGSLYLATPVQFGAPSNVLTNAIKIELAPHLPPGTYTLRAKRGTDGNTFLDMCDEELPLPDQITFMVPDLDSTVELKVCPQQMPFTWNGITVTAPGTNVASFIAPNVIGCDSLSTLNLIVEDTMRDTVNLLVCPFELPYTWHGITVPAPGMSVATFHTNAAGGCDSAVTLNLALLLPAGQTLNLSACGPLVFDGKTYTYDQVAYDTLKGYMGCDSIHRTLNITIHPPITPVVEVRDTAGCGSFLFEGVLYLEDTQLKDTIPNQFGCDSVYRTVNISVYPGTKPIRVTDTVSDCSNVLFEGVTYTRDTTLVRLLPSKAGCDSVERTVRIIIRELGLVLESDPEEPVKGDYVTLTAKADVPFAVLAWEPSAMFPNQTSKGQNFIIKEDGVYKVIAISDLGCTDTAELKLRADSLIPVAVMPNAFSPNGDGLNDEFRPMFVSKSGYAVKRFFIYNRWGREVYHAFNTKSAAWNGLYGNTGAPAEPGTYFYMIEIEFLDKTKATFKGEIALIR